MIDYVSHNLTFLSEEHEATKRPVLGEKDKEVIPSVCP